MDYIKLKCCNMDTIYIRKNAIVAVAEQNVNSKSSRTLIYLTNSDDAFVIDDNLENIMNIIEEERRCSQGIMFMVGYEPDKMLFGPTLNLGECLAFTPDIVGPAIYIYLTAENNYKFPIIKWNTKEQKWSYLS